MQERPKAGRKDHALPAETVERIEQLAMSPPPAGRRRWTTLVDAQYHRVLERSQLPLPLRSGRARRHTHDYKRHGVVDLYAALEVATGKVVSETNFPSTKALREHISAFMRSLERSANGVRVDEACGRHHPLTSQDT